MNHSITEKNIDVLIIGGGPAGLAAAVRLWKNGVRSLIVVEREKQLGGILRQCIHDGFGLSRFGTTLTGPEYANKFVTEVKSLGIPFLTNAAVIGLTPDKKVTVTTREGLLEFHCKAVILAMGCRERTRGALAIPGERPAGVFTAGVAQAYMNLYNRMPAKEVVILGSGDIGMIMARRLTLEGAHVKAVYEVMPIPSGLPRNIEQCLRDYNIPLFLSHTVTDIHGGTRLTGVTVSKVDEHLKPIPGTQEEIACDTLILSVGLIPENELSLEAGVLLDPKTKGAIVDEHYQTSVPGIFSAGNVLHVHDLVDFVSLEAERLADSAAAYIKSGGLTPCPLAVHYDKTINHVIPMRVSGQAPFHFAARVSRPMTNAVITIRQNGQAIATRTIRRALPAEMIQFDVSDKKLRDTGDLYVSAEESD
ncbi:MAG: NAD(P)/FAD-dependent oxidoreductase [Lachnospiraceae bacterium]|jgi:NADPH-dependent 2,4-dienoyl-CoA reductase/sulfur reductase-like enzyme